MKRLRSARIYRDTPRNLARLAAALRRGELVAVPTETVYGLAANALNSAACKKIFTAKGRPANDPLIVHIGHWRELPSVAEPNAAALKLARKFWPGPLTLVLPKKSTVPAIVSSGLRSVAVRLPSHPVFRRLQRLAGIPLAAPSANQFGYVSPTTAAHVFDGLGKKIPHILDGGPTAIGLESTIVDLRDPRRPRLLRLGAVTRMELEEALGCTVADASKRRAAVGRAQLAPGRLSRHYSPRTPVELHRRLNLRGAERHAANEAWLYFGPPDGVTGENIFVLSPDRDIGVAAQRLFGLLRRLDAGRFAKIHVELAPRGGLGDAINDRLRRAASRRE
ncbi:MAG: threonylcarbamoyl-AMP synthase [Opitutus sp.]|nr:threonylcarbamoyl-AMP synthase [Opitutus sp.]